MSDRKYHIETLAVHAGQDAHGDAATNARAVPVYRTTAYNFRDSKHGADLFALRELGNIYARLMNPTNDVLAKRIAALEGGAAAQTLASGTAAIYFTITNIARTGDEIVAADNLYGGTFSQFDAILPNIGIKVRFTPVNDFGAVEAAINEKTRLLFIEAVGNPALDIADIEKYAEIAHRHHLPLVVDATFTPPPLLRAALHAEHYHAARAVRQVLCRQLGICERRILHPRHLRLVLEVLRHGERVFAVPRDAERQRLHALEEDPRRVRRERRALVADPHRQEADGERNGLQRLRKVVREAEAVVAGVRLVV